MSRSAKPAYAGQPPPVMVAPPLQQKLEVLVRRQVVDGGVRSEITDQIQGVARSLARKAIAAIAENALVGDPSN
jgi:hypothetical protein